MFHPRMMNIWALDKPTGQSFEIEATRTVINAYRLLGGTAFFRMLSLLVRTWHGVPSSMKSSIISGMALFVKTYETELSDTTFINRLSAVDPDEIIRRGKVDFSTNKAALRFARVIWDKYTVRLRRCSRSSSAVSTVTCPWKLEKLSLQTRLNASS